MSEIFQAARATDPIGHGYGMLGILAGVVVGAVIVAAGVVTGGAAIALVIAAGALSGAALANGIQRVAGAKNPWTGNIGFGSANVRINSLGAARVIMDFGSPICNGLYGVNHFALLPIPPIAEGSKTVRINSQPAARVTSRLICAADITDGSPNVWIGGPTAQVLPVIDIEAILTTAAMAVVIGATFVISGPVLGLAYIAGGFAVSEGINYLADNYLGEGWGDIINGTLGFLALGLGATARARNLKRTVRDSANQRVQNYSRSKDGPCLTGVHEPVTGKIYEGTNFPKNRAGNEAYQKFVDQSHPLLKERIQNRQAAIDEGKRLGRPEFETVDHRAGAHSEVVALDKALKAREAATGRRVTEADLNEILLHNRNMPKTQIQMDRCPNCSVITNGVRTVGHK